MNIKKVFIKNFLGIISKVKNEEIKVFNLNKVIDNPVLFLGIVINGTILFGV